MGSALKRLRAAGTALASSVFLAACGGGGSSAPAASPPSTATTASITASNYQDYQPAMARAVIGARSGVAADGAATSAGGTGNTAAALSGLGGRAVAMSVARPAATGVRSTNCPFGGTLTVQLNDADNNGAMSAGDAITITANQCVEASGQHALNGTMAMTVNSVSQTSLDVSGSFSHFGDTTTLDGGYRLAVSDNGTTTNLTLSYVNLTVGGDTTIKYNTTITGSETPTATTLSIAGSVTLSAGTYSFEQLAPFSAAPTADYPTSGALKLYDPAGNAVVMTANANGKVSFAFYPAGAATPAASTAEQAWSAFAQ